MSAALALLRDLDEAHATMTRCAEALDWDGVAAAWRQAERDAGARWIAASAARWPALARIAARLTRIA